MVGKRLMLFIFFITSFFKEGFTQNIFFDLRGTKKRADIYYSKLSYSKAIELYSQALQKKKNKSNYSLNKKAADLYRKMGLYKEAKSCFDNLVNTGYIFTHQDSIDYYNIAKASGINEAEMNIFSQQKSNNLFRDTLYYRISSFPLNTSHSEYCPVSFKKGLIYVSDQDPSSLVKKYNALNDGGFASLLYAEKKDTNWTTSRKIKIDIEALHVGPMTIYNGQKNAIINVCIEDKKKPYRLLLYKTEYDESEERWEILSALPFNNKEYSVGHPAMSEDGKKMFFISDKKGGIGGTDIYVSDLIDGQWSNPVNMGTHINTEGNEQYPYISNDNILFFSSDGRYGLGGSDIYYVDLSFQDSTVYNIGAPINSNLDDFGFSYDHVIKTGYFSSNRSSKGKSDDIYWFKENKILLKVILKDDLDKSNIKNAEIYLLDHELNAPVRHVYEDSLTISAWLKPAHLYKMIIKKDDYKNDTLLISTYDIKDYFKPVLKTVLLKRKSMYYASVKLQNRELKEEADSSFIVVNNITSNKKDTISCKGTWYNVKLDSECEYIITSRNKDSLRYIYVEKKAIKDLFSKPYYNMYLASPKPMMYHIILKKCHEDIFEEKEEVKIKVVDWVNGNEFFISPGPDGDFQFVITDSRLFSFYLNENKISYSTSVKKIISEEYCISIVND